MSARFLEVLAPVSAALSLGLLALLPDAPGPGIADWPAMPALERLAVDTLPAGESIHWRDDTLGFEATLTAERPFLDPDGRVCRLVTGLVQTAEDDEARSSRRQVCRREDGGWQSVEAPAAWPPMSIGRMFPGAGSPQVAESRD